MKKLLTLLAFVVSTISSYAYDCKVDGIYYNLSDSEATVTFGDNGYLYTGTVVVPEKISFNGTTYSVTSIGYYAFGSCSDLTSITIPSSVTSIDGSAFWDCSALTSINIPNSVTSIGGYAFFGCSSLPIIDDIRYADTYLTEVVNKSITSANIKEGTRFIGDSAFQGCSNLTSINIPNSVMSIGAWSFSGCSNLISISIPNSVTSIDGHAFNSCSAIKDLFCFAETLPTTGLNTFTISDIKSATLHVPAVSLEAYKSTVPWSEFGTILPIENVEPSDIAVTPRPTSGNKPQTTGSVYTLDGKRVKTMEKGKIYIVGGVKMIVK